MSSARPPATQYAGQRLGLPPAGRGSVAGWVRRFAALGLDWLASVLVAGAFIGPGALSSQTWRGWVPMLVFLCEASLLTALVGGSFGQLLVRIAVVRGDRRPVTLSRALLRTALVCLVVPPLIYDRDHRGLHDMAVGTVVVKR